jgi:hypothetical protein
MAESVADRVMAQGQPVTTTMNPATAGRQSLGYDWRSVSENAPLQNTFGECVYEWRTGV